VKSVEIGLYAPVWEVKALMQPCVWSFFVISGLYIGTMAAMVWITRERYFLFVQLLNYFRKSREKKTV
jgi:hypothetical protein